MTIEKYKSVITACNDTILLAKKAAKDHPNTPIIVRHAQQMVLNAGAARAAVIEEAMKKFDYINWLNYALGSELKSDIDTKTGKVRVDREALVLKFMPNKPVISSPPNNGN